MSVILPIAAVLDVTNDSGVCFKHLAPAIDQANASAQQIVTDLNTTIGSSDLAHLIALYPFVAGIYGRTAGPGSSPTNPFGAATGIAAGSFGTGQGTLNRISLINGNFFAWLEALRKDMATYGSAIDIVDLSTYAAYQNGQTPYSCLYTPDFAHLFWYGYNQGQQLAAASVFAPQGVVMGTFAVSAADAGLFLPGLFPTANAYTVLPTGVSCGKIAITALNTASLSGAESNAGSPVAYCPAAITGTATVTVTALNQNSVSATFTANVSNTAAGATIPFTPTNTGDTMVGAPSAAAVAGTATAGTIYIVQGGAGVDSYGNALWAGAMAMPQGFAPLKNAVMVCTTTFNGTASITVAAPNQNGVSENWTGSMSSVTAGTTVAVSPTTGGDRMYGTPTSVTISGTATVGAFTIESGAAERAY